MKKEYKYASIFFAIIAVGIISISYFYDEVDLKEIQLMIQTLSDKKFLRISPELKGFQVTSTHHQKKLNKMIKVNVVLYDFWTYSCINCIRTLPYLTAWDEKYGDEGLVIVGIHTPEFEFEKNMKM